MLESTRASWPQPVPTARLEGIANHQPLKMLETPMADSMAVLLRPSPETSTPMINSACGRVARVMSVSLADTRKLVGSAVALAVLALTPTLSRPNATTAPPALTRTRSKRRSAVNAKRATTRLLRALASHPPVPSAEQELTMTLQQQQVASTAPPAHSHLRSLQKRPPCALLAQRVNIPMPHRQHVRIVLQVLSRPMTAWALVTTAGPATSKQARDPLRVMNAQRVTFHWKLRPYARIVRLVKYLPMSQAHVLIVLLVSTRRATHAAAARAARQRAIPTAAIPAQRVLTLPRAKQLVETVPQACTQASDRVRARIAALALTSRAQVLQAA